MDTVTLFAAGDYTGSAHFGVPDHWQTHTALSLIGFSSSAIAKLQKHSAPEAKFHLAVAHWIDGNDQLAQRLLKSIDTQHAKNLLALISKPKIRAIAQSVWGDQEFTDPKFEVRNVGLRRKKISDAGYEIPNNDTPTEPFTDILKSITGQPAPDFYFANMLEWELLPPNLRDLPCPTFGVTSDFDLHIQNVLPWLPHFDELITVGSEEWEKVRRLSGRPVSVFPKMFGLPKNLLSLKSGDRPVDLHISGTIANPYHPDKAQLLQQLLRHDVGNVRYVDGFVTPTEYYDQLSEAKASFTYVRHATSMPSRGLEALAMGCAVVTQKGSPLTIWAGEKEGVFTYDSPEELPAILKKVKENWDEIAPHARRGAEIIRREFVLSKCISQFLRYLTVLAAKPRPARQPVSREGLHQKRGVLRRGHCFAMPTSLFMLTHNAERWMQEAKHSAKPRPAINCGRELDLFVTGELTEAPRHVDTLKMDTAEKQAMKDGLFKDRNKLVRRAEGIYSEALQKYPRSLVLLFNALRHAFHLGNPTDIPQALSIAANAVRQPTEYWEIDAMDDVFPWDYHSTFFNYRSYIDTLTNGLAAGNVDRKKLAELILASIHYYLGHYSGDTTHFRRAAELDGDFPFYRFYLAESLRRSDEATAMNEAAALFTDLAQTSILVEPAFHALAELNVRHGVVVPQLPAIESAVRKLRNISEASNHASDDFLAIDLVLPTGISRLPTRETLNEASAIPHHTPLASHLASGGKKPKRPSILLIPFECANWQNARAWSYNGYFAFEEGFRAQRAEFLTLPAIAGVPSNHPASWLKYAKELCAGRTFDQVWVWVTHNHYTPEFFEWIKQVAPVRVGVVMESMEHTPAEYASYPMLPGRRERVLDQLRHMTHVLTFDDHDADTFPADLPIKALWCPPVVPWRSVAAQVDLPDLGPAIFHGTIYSPERKALLEDPLLAGKLSKPALPEEKTILPKLFDLLQAHSLNRLNAVQAAEMPVLTNYLADLRRLRRQLFDLWLEGLRAGYASVNLPSIFKCYAGRVVESMAAGRPAISWDVPRLRTKALFTPGREILLFDKDKPEELAAQIERLQKDPAFARQLAENARQKVLRYHTAEIRVRQILDWIQDGKQPDYGENTTIDLGTHLAVNCLKTSVPMSQPSARQHEALTAASTLLSQGDRAGAVEILKAAAEELPQHPETLRALGTQLFLLQRHDEATVAFVRLTQLLPNDAKTQIQLAAAAVKAGQIETFETALGRALELEPDNVAALKLLAGLCLQQGQYKEAGQSYLRLAQIDANDSDVLHGLGVCFFKSGDFETAQAVYERILSLVPGDTLAKENLDVVRGKLAGTNAPTTTASPAPSQPAPAARETLAQALERAEFFLQSGNKIAARTELERAAELSPRNDQVIDSLGGLQYSAGDFEAARKSFRRLIELRPRDTQAYTLLAMATLKCNRLDEFESAIGLALEIDPQNQTALEFLAKTNLEHGRFADAGRFFTKLLELRGDDADTLLALGICFVRGNDHDSARMVYERVLEMQPHNTTAHENLGVLKKLATAATPAAPQKNDASQIVAQAKTSIQTGDILRAVSLLESALATQPDNADAVEILGKIRFGSNDFARARDLFLKLTKLAPTVPGAWVNLALSSYKLDDVAAFEEALGHALELDPNNWQTLTVLAQLSFNHQNWSDAAQTYARVVQQRPDDIEAILPLGVCFFKAGQHDSAAEMFRRVLELDPNNTLAADNLQAAEKALQPPTLTPPAPPAAVGPQAPAPADIRVETGDTGTARPSSKILPPCAKLGMLEQAETHLKAGDHLGAWNVCLAAIAQRPFHPDAYLQMAEIALDAKDEQQALRCVKRLLRLTPKWDVPNNVQRSLKQQRKLATTQIAWTPLPELPARLRLSVCLIVKNEERFLAQCLRSVKGVAHQIVVVDTGSTDRTVEIAKEHGAEVYHFAWNDNFSDARNFALEHARGDWVLSLDADEELMAESIEKLWCDLAAPNAIGYRIPLKNHIDTADGVTYVPRLFRNAPALYFIGRVHEQIYTTVIVRQNHWQMEAPMGTATLMHYGYDPEVKKEKNKVRRNLDLLEHAVIEIPDEPALLMNFGLDLVNDGQMERGLEQYRKAVAIIEKHDSKNVLPEVRERLMTMFIFHLLTAEHYEETIRVATSRLAQDCGPTASMHYVAALGHIKLGQHAEAIPQLYACIAKAKQPILTPACQGVTGAPPYHLLADCLAREGKATEAEKEIKRALELDPQSVGIRHAYAKLLISQKRGEEALPLLHQGAVDGRMDAILWKLGCEIVNGVLNLPDLALEWTEAALADHPDNEELRKHRGIALLTAGKAAEALPFFEGAPNPTHPVVAGAIILCRLLAGSPATVAQPSNESAVSQEFISWYRRLLTHNSAKAVHEVNRLLPVLQPLLPTATKVLREATAGANDAE